VEKKFLLLIIFVFLFGFISSTGIFYFTIYKPTANKYQIAIDKFERQDEIIRREYNKLVESNRTTEEQLIAARDRNIQLIENNRRTENIIGELSKAIFGATEDLQGIIDSISAVIDSIEADKN